jgi:transposase
MEEADEAGTTAEAGAMSSESGDRNGRGNAFSLGIEGDARGPVVVGDRNLLVDAQHGSQRPSWCTVSARYPYAGSRSHCFRASSRSRGRPSGGAGGPDQGVRDGITSLFAAFNIADGTVISELHRRHRAVEFKKFLTRIDKAVPIGLDVHLVCDNYATHNTAEIKTWLGKHSSFHVHFTPTGSSWMNQVERWFGLLTDKLIRRGVHTSVKALENDIRAWIEQWNQNPKPFTWTKTADEILNSLADYLTKINPPTTNR